MSRPLPSFLRALLRGPGRGAQGRAPRNAPPTPPALCSPQGDPPEGAAGAGAALPPGALHSRAARSPQAAVRNIAWRAAGSRSPVCLLQVSKLIFLRTRASKVAHESPKRCSQQLFSWLEKEKEITPSLASNRHPKTSPRRVGFSLSVSSWARVLAPAFPGPSPWPPPLLPTLPDPEGAAGPGRGRCA